MIKGTDILCVGIVITVLVAGQRQPEADETSRILRRQAGGGETAVEEIVNVRAIETNLGAPRITERRST